MRRMAFVIALSLVLLPFTVFADGHPWDIAIDVGKEGGNPTIDPPKPVAKIGEDDILVVQILSDGKRPAENRAQLRFTQSVRVVEKYDTKGIPQLRLQAASDRSAGAVPEFTLAGTSHVLRFKKCTEFAFGGENKQWPTSEEDTATGKGSKTLNKTDCPIIVATGHNSVTIYANTDAIGLIAEVDQTDAPDFAPEDIQRASATVRTIRPYWNLQYSGGLSFFSGANVRDETYSIQPRTDDPLTAVDESEQSTIVSTGRGEAAYEFGIFATYMIHRPKQWPVGVTFGVSTKVPVDELTGIAGVSLRIKPFLLIDSAFVTAGIAYRGHQRLLPKYRKDMLAPAGVSESDIVANEHDVGLVFAIHFGFGGNEQQFRSVISGNNGNGNE